MLRACLPGDAPAQQKLLDLIADFYILGAFLKVSALIILLQIELRFFPAASGFVGFDDYYRQFSARLPVRIREKG